LNCRFSTTDFKRQLDSQLFHDFIQNSALTLKVALARLV
jgi:hypothetical protein